MGPEMEAFFGEPSRIEIVSDQRTRREDAPDASAQVNEEEANESKNVKNSHAVAFSQS